MKRTQYFEKGFTRVEASAVVALVSIICIVAITSLADNRGRSQKLACIDNLRQIGQGFDIWRFEHQDLPPWQVPVTNGGTLTVSVGLPWIEYTFLSNIISSPRILVCPSDLKAFPRTAQNWGSGSGGFQNSGYRNNTLSYTLGLHAVLEAPYELLCSDRNLAVDSLNVGCSYANIPNASGIFASSPTSRGAWTNDVHGLIGNVLVNDGSVREQTIAQLKAFLRSDEDNYTLHVLIP